MTTPDLALRLDLEQHPEGGWFRRTWTSSATVTLADGRVRRTASMIWFLLPAGESSRWHRVASDEMWLAHQGTVRIELGGSDAAPGDATLHTVSAEDPASSQFLVPAGVWQRTLPSEEEALVRCVVSPEFSFEDFEMVE
jgi:predicted cupin superfamily sugar epimerase